MTQTDQLTYFARREQQQRDFAARARNRDIRAFHEHLIDHYARLARETRQA